MFEFVNRSKGREVSIVVVVICASYAGYGVCKSFFVKLFLSKRINSFPALQCGCYGCYVMLS